MEIPKEIPAALSSDSNETEMKLSRWEPLIRKISDDQVPKT